MTANRRFCLLLRAAIDDTRGSATWMRALWLIITALAAAIAVWCGESRRP